MSNKRKQGEEAPSMKEVLLFAIDFGTTFSGMVFAHTGKHEITGVIDDYPAGGGRTQAGRRKVPTEISYGDDRGKDTKFGLMIHGKDRRYAEFKIDFDSKQAHAVDSLAARYPNSKALPLDAKHTAEELVTEYLRWLYRHAVNNLRKKLMAQAVRDETPRLYCFTVPAIWTEGTRSRLLECAKKAGLQKNAEILLVTEPEAAATYVLDAMNPTQLQVGQTFVLCDCGGGTVDLISYEILQLKPHLKVNEAGPGTGRYCGSVIINRQCEDYLTKKYGKDKEWSEEVLSEAMTYFDTIVKPRFSGPGHGDEDLPLRLSDNRNLGVRRGHIKIPCATIDGWFLAVFTEIYDLIEKQVHAMGDKYPAAILLVGGFGQCAYLRNYIEQRLLGFDIDVIQPAEGESAIMRGALMKAKAHHNPKSMRVRVTNRAARKHYGVDSWVPYKPNIHDKTRELQWYPSEKQYRLRVMEWFINKGDTIVDQKPISLPFFLDVPVSEGVPKDEEVAIMCCEDPEDKGAPTYPDTVVELVKFTADLSRIPVKELPKHCGADGIEYYRIAFKITMKNLLANTKYELKYKNKNLGEVTAEYA